MRLDNEKIWVIVSDRAEKENVDLVVLCGDLTDFEKGNWIARLNWSDKNGKHYLEKNFKIQ